MFRFVQYNYNCGVMVNVSINHLNRLTTVIPLTILVIMVNSKIIYPYRTVARKMFAISSRTNSKLFVLLFEYTIEVSHV